MSNRTRLVLEAERHDDGHLPPLPPLPPGVPAEIANGEPTLNHVHLLGEAFEQDTSEALRHVDHAYRRLDEWPFPPGVTPFSYFIDDDFPVLLDAWDRVAARLVEAIDDEGRPRGDLGARLAAAPWIEVQPDGTLAFLAHRIPVLRIRDALGELRRMFRAALDLGLNVRMEVI